MTAHWLEVGPMRSARLTIAAALALALLGAVAPPSAHAHAELVSSSPAAGETLTAPPDEVRIEFDGELLPDGTGFTVTDPGGGTAGEGELDLTIADRNQLSGPVEISEPGTYVVAWTAVSADGHREEGEFYFSVAGPAQPPNTAAAPTEPGVTSTLGPMLLLAAVLTGVRRLRRAYS
ncbi:MAG TPA: copper resistance CopC family protein [Candidatus Limnocylindrales bacterium]|nr:copper resistance CopC family protein [Candidatus Limnocylindrales bacterium]